jgi:hypothetical protein
LGRGAPPAPGGRAAPCRTAGRARPRRASRAPRGRPRMRLETSGPPSHERLAFSSQALARNAARETPIASYICRVRPRSRLRNSGINSLGGSGAEWARGGAERRGEDRVISDCHFRKIATEYDRKTGIKWLSCTAK